MERVGKIFSTFVLYVAISIVVMGLDKLGIFGWARGLTEAIVNPFSKGIRGVIILVNQPIKAAQFAFIGAERMAKIESRLAEVLVDQVRLEEFERENEALRELIQAPLPSEWSYIPAPVLGGKEELVIGVGAVDGVSVNDTVVSEAGVLVGRVDRVSYRTSWAITPYKLGEKIPVKVRRRATEGLLIGDGEGVFLDQVEQTEELYVDDVVLTSGLEGNYFAGLVVGFVSEFVGNPADVYKKAKIDLALPLNEKIVFIVNSQSGNN